MLSSKNKFHLYILLLQAGDGKACQPICIFLLHFILNYTLTRRMYGFYRVSCISIKPTILLILDLHSKL